MPPAEARRLVPRGCVVHLPFLFPGLSDCLTLSQWFRISSGPQVNTVRRMRSPLVSPGLLSGPFPCVRCYKASELMCIFLNMYSGVLCGLALGGVAPFSKQRCDLRPISTFVGGGEAAGQGQVRDPRPGLAASH